MDGIVFEKGDTSSASIVREWGSAQLPVGRWMGIDEQGRNRNPTSLYTPGAQLPEHLSFDLSNNQLLASVERNGQVKYAAVVTGLDREQLGGFNLRGVPGSKKLVTGGPWTVSVEPEDAAAPDAPVAVAYESALLPFFSQQLGSVGVVRRVFAPIGATFAASPRALIYQIELTNTGTNEARGTLTATTGTVDPARAAASVLLLDQPASDHPRTHRYVLAPGSRTVVSFAFVLDQNEEAARRTSEQLRAQSADAWLGHTRARLAATAGSLSMPDAPFWPEFLTRMAELCRQPIMHLADGSSGGMFIGSNLQENKMWNANLWMKDCFYEVLPMAQLAPELVATAIPFFLDWGMPPKAYGRGTERYPDAAPETHSLSLSLAPFILAGKYYEATGDRAYFKAYPKLLDVARHRLQTILASRQDPDVFLFPSMYVSDGDARGDWHTGANLLAWYSFQSMARLAADAYGDAALAREWNEIADKIARDIRARCIGPSKEGPRYFEGASRNGTFEIEKDGEESDMALMPFYGFTTPDDPALIRHHRSGMSTENPLYSKELDAIWWYDNSWHGATFPAWMTALAAVTNETELAARLDRIASLADVDGSVWWWPYDYGTKNRTKVLRKPVKCAWAAGVFVCKFIHDVIGLRVDVPARSVAFRPFHPWNQLNWTTAPMGAARFDVQETKAAGRRTALLRNRNAEPYRALVELVLPPQAKPAACNINGRATDAFTLVERFGRATVRIETDLAAGQALEIEILHN